jgi:hypothetical protein
MYPRRASCYLVVIVLLASMAIASDENAESSGWRDLFDGKTLTGWKVTNFGGEGDVRVVDGTIEMDFGGSLTGITYTKEVPSTNYEVRLEAKRVDGIDFFGTTTFPVHDSFCSLVLGGWSGSVVGLSNINDQDASANETTRFIKFQAERWYRIRIRVTDKKIQAWIDDKQIVDQQLEGRKISTRAEVELSQPLGVSAYETRAALRRIQVRKLKPTGPKH